MKYEKIGRIVKDLLSLPGVERVETYILGGDVCFECALGNLAGINVTLFDDNTISFLICGNKSSRVKISRLELLKRDILSALTLVS